MVAKIAIYLCKGKAVSQGISGLYSLDLFQNYPCYGPVLSVSSWVPSALHLLQTGPWHPEVQHEDPAAISGKAMMVL